MHFFFGLFLIVFFVVSQTASRIVQHLIEEFATTDLFGRENYEFYARVTGRVLRVQDQWICSFQYPPINVKDPMYPNEFVALEPYLIGKSMFVFFSVVFLTFVGYM